MNTNQESEEQLISENDSIQLVFKDENETITNQVEGQKFFKSKNFYHLDPKRDIDQILLQIESLKEIKQIIGLKITIETPEMFGIVNELIQYFSQITHLQINFINDWYFQILNFHNENFFEEYKALENLTHLEVKFENHIFTQVLCDFGEIIAGFKNLIYLHIAIPSFYNELDEYTYVRFKKGIQQLLTLTYLQMEIGNISQDNSLSIIILFELIQLQANLQTLVLSINKQITKEETDSLIDTICSLDKLESLSINAQAIVNTKKIEDLFIHISKLQTLQCLSLNVYGKSIFKDTLGFAFKDYFENLGNVKNLSLQIGPDKKFNETKFIEIVNGIQLLPYLQELSLELCKNNKIGTQGQIQLSNLLNQQINLKKLNLNFNYGNNIDSKGMNYILQSIERNTELISFKFNVGQKNYFKEQIQQKLCSALQKLLKLESLNLNIQMSELTQINNLKESIKSLRDLKELKIDLGKVSQIYLINFLTLINFLPKIQRENLIIRNLDFQYKTESNLVKSLKLNIHKEESVFIQDQQLIDFQNLCSLEISVNQHPIFFEYFKLQLKNLNCLTKLKITIQNTLENEEANTLGQCLSEIPQLTSLGLIIPSQCLQLSCLKNLILRITSLTKLKKLQYNIPTKFYQNQINQFFFLQLNALVVLTDLSIKLEEFNIDENLKILGETIKKLRNLRIIELNNIHLNINEENMKNYSQLTIHLVEITSLELEINYKTYYDLKYLYDKGISNLINLRHLKINHTPSIEYIRMRKQRSKIIRKALRLVIFNT